VSTPKSPPRGLTFNPKGHTYKLDGKPIPGVTTIIGQTLPKPAIPYWAARTVAEYVASDPHGVAAMVEQMGQRAAVAALKEIPWQRRDDAAVRGTEVHALAERLVHGYPVEVPEQLAGYVEGHAAFLDAFDVQPIATETPCASRTGWYAGTLDAIVTIGRGRYAGRSALLDWKTSSGVYGETGLQTAAYARAEFLAPAADVEDPVPDVDLLGVVHVTADGSHLYILADGGPAIDELHRTFRHLAWLYPRIRALKDLITQPINPNPEEHP